MVSEQAPLSNERVVGLSETS
jgi:hypothetical protein